MRRKPSVQRKKPLFGLLLVAAGSTALIVQAAQADPGPAVPPPLKGKHGQPTISGFAPSSGPPGSRVTVSGSNFNGVGRVAFNGAGSSYTVNSSTQITATVPAGATTGPITVVTGTGTVPSGSSFTVTAANAPTGIFVSPTGSDTTGDGSISKPFATLGKAQATMRLGGPQTTYIRGGFYPLPAVTQNGVTYGLRLTSADSGQTWSYYPPDGYDSAILDGGSTSKSTGIKELIALDGASHVTVNGLQLQHFRWIGVGVHGGGGFYELFPAGAPTADGNSITNNVIHDGGYDLSPVFGFGGGGFYSEGNTPNTDGRQQRRLHYLRLRNRSPGRKCRPGRQHQLAADRQQRRALDLSAGERLRRNLRPGHEHDVDRHLRSTTTSFATPATRPTRRARSTSTTASLERPSPAT